MVVGLAASGFWRDEELQGGAPLLISRVIRTLNWVIGILN